MDATHVVDQSVVVEILELDPNLRAAKSQGGEAKEAKEAKEADGVAAGEVRAARWHFDALAKANESFETVIDRAEALNLGDDDDNKKAGSSSSTEGEGAGEAGWRKGLKGTPKTRVSYCVGTQLVSKYREARAAANQVQVRSSFLSFIGPKSLTRSLLFDE